MYKTLLRTLSALSIVTITASVGFAQSTGDTDCAAPWNQDHEDCTVSTKIWLDGFTPSIKSIGATNGADNGFVEFGTNGFNNAEGNLILEGNPKRGKLNLKADVVNDDGDIVNETIGGVLFYRDLHMASSSYLYYAGIKSGTNLGRPLTNALAGASWTKDWTGDFKAVGGINRYNVVENDFELNVIFGGGTGTISALVQQAGQAHYRIAGEFDSKGVITGKVIYGLFDISRDKTTPHTDVGRIDGTLSGLIGDQGAVGVFVSDTNRDSYGVYGFAGGFVVNSHFTAAEAALLRRCAADPFDSGCSDTKFDARKIARIEHCVTDNNWVSDGDCFSALIATGSTTGDRVSCISNPFQTACKDANADYAEQYMIARDNRAVFCGKSTNSESDLCKGDTIVAGVCGVNPFGEVCEGKFDEAANNRLIECQQDGVAGGTQCAHADTIIDKCKLAPFEDECAWGAFDDERKKLIATCHNGGKCADAVLERPNAATWVNTLKTEEGESIVLSNVPGAVNPQHQFLKNVESAQMNTRIDIGTYPGSETAYYWSLDLETAKFSIDGTPVSLGGDAEDGMAYFHGKAKSQRHSGNYAGIFSKTDLGAPLTTPSDDEPKTVRWVGSFREEHYSPRDFILEVNFDKKSIEAFIAGLGYNNPDYLLKGDYDDSGLISGTVTAGSFRGNDRDQPGYISQRLILTGLIGKEGAVGLYIRGGYRGGFVARPADLVNGAETFLDSICTEDPFHEFCYLSQDARKTRIDQCITGNKAGTSRCTGAIEYQPCILNPFNERCKTTFDGYNASPDKPYYQIARANRIAFCNVSANATDNLCMGAEQSALCSYDLFHKICDNVANYDNARKVVCRSELDSERCANYQPSGNVTTASWLHSFYEGNGAVRRTVTGEGIDTLNLNTATFDGQSLGGDAANGVAFSSYGGILSGTDLGTPFVETTIGMKFYGQFQYDPPRYETSKTDFTLDITFNAESTDGTVNAFVHHSGLYYYRLTGDFDSNGVISGTVDFGFFRNHDQIVSEIYSTSVLTGLIGTEGAVGLFTGDHFGGFVAVPEADVTFDSNIKFSDWVGSFDKPPYPTVPRDEPQQTRFLQGKETDLGKRYLWVTSPGSLTFANGDLGGAGAGGVAYMSGIHRRNYRNTHHVAGLLSGTNLGAVLGAAGANGAITAIWDGKLGLIANQVEIPKRDIKLAVDFTNKEISYSDALNGAHFVDLRANWESGVGYDGVLKGTITYNPGAALDNLDADSTKNSAGTVTGLIGQQGAVGAFRSNHVDNPTATHTSYAGGFVAVPVANYLIWKHSFGNPTTLPTRVPWYADGQPQTEFLQGGETDLDPGFINNPVPRSLDFVNSGLGGEATDGVAYLSGTWEVLKPGTTVRMNVLRHFAGILSGTNLGALLNAPVTATWNGKLGLIVDGNGDIPKRDITLNIDFANTGITIADTKTSNNTHFVNFNNLVWDENGVITGEVTYNPGSALDDATNSPGTVRGLIGQQGAVGAFISDHGDAHTNHNTPYAGGFVARPPSE